MEVPNDWDFLFGASGRNFQNFLQIVHKYNGTESFVMLNELLATIEQKFEHLKNEDLFRDVVPIFYNVICINLDHKNKTIGTITTFLERLMRTKSTNEDIELILKLIYQILVTFIESNVNDLENNANVYENVTNYLFSDYKPVHVLSLQCLSLIVEKFKVTGVLGETWEKIKNEKCPPVHKLRVLNYLQEHFFNEGKVFKEVEYWEMLYNALELNTESVAKKHGICILKGTIEALKAKDGEINLKIESYIDWDKENRHECYKSWMIFFAIYENLAEKQSHLILPALEMFAQIKNIFKFKDLLISEMLKHKNVLVLKWSTDYILKSVKITDMQSDSLLYDLLVSLNNTFLFTKENRFDECLLVKFVEPDVQRFLKVFAKVNWKSVPMHVCLKVLSNWKDKNENCSILCDDQILLEIATKIRQLLNRYMREMCKTLYLKLFEKELNNLKILLQVVSVIETKNDVECPSLERKLIETIHKYERNYGDASINIYTLEILARSYNVLDVKDDIIKLFMQSNPTADELLKAMSFEKLKLSLDPTFIVFVFQKLSIRDLSTNPTTEDIVCRIRASTDPDFSFYMKYIFLQRALVSKNHPKLDEFNIFETVENFKIPGCYINELKQIFVDSYVRFMRRDMEYDWILENMMSLIDIGGHNALEDIIWALFSKRDFIISTIQFDRILAELKNYIKKHGCSNIWRRFHLLVGYIMKNFYYERYTLLNKILDIDRENLDIHKIVYDTFHQKITGAFDEYECHTDRLYFHLDDKERDFLIEGLTFGVALHGDEKTEWEYRKQIGDFNIRWSSEIRYKCFEILNAIKACREEGLNSFLANLKDKILEKSLALNATKPRYFDNSNQHRLKLRLTQALAILQGPYEICRKEYLVTILEENNQTNVNIIMEIIIANSIEWSELDDLLKKITDLPPSRQVSVLHVAFLFLLKHRGTIWNKKVLEIIIPLIMGQNFSTRFYAQLFLLKSPKLFVVDDTSAQLVKSIEKSLIPLKDKVSEEVRFAGSSPMDLLKKVHVLHIIPYKTNMAMDELFGKEYYIEWHFPEITDLSQIRGTEPNLEIYENIQRKMNPLQFEDCFSSDIFYSQRKKKQKNNADIIVVASLINKLPNLGGIARTCEVFGVGTLVLGSLRFTENTEFKSLSMTAEKWLNIIEVRCDDLRDFLCKKKLDGYQILGAEQTKESICFTQFKFPKKTVLLLGHEKEGIPGNLISFLDHAVEIPQFGMVRSLNVHVTAALFMWEYRKQMMTT